MTLFRFATVGILAVLGSIGAPVLAQVNTDTETASGSITILQPLTLTKNDDLVFGRVVRPASGSGSATIAATSGAQTVAGGGAVALDTANTKPASFTASGEGGATISVSIPSSFNMTGPGAPIVVTTSNDLTNPAATSLGGTLGSASSKSFFVGGAATIPSTQQSGAYSGSFNVTVTYN